MRAAFLAAILAGCASEAELMLELHRASTSSTVMIDVCDAARPEDCDLVKGVDFGGDLICRLGLYVDDTITPPLSVRILQGNPGTCRMLDVDPARESGLVVVQLPSTDNGDLVIGDCPTCEQRACP